MVRRQYSTEPPKPGGRRPGGGVGGRGGRPLRPRELCWVEGLRWRFLSQPADQLFLEPMLSGQKRRKTRTPHHQVGSPKPRSMHQDDVRLLALPLAAHAADPVPPPLLARQSQGFVGTRLCFQCFFVCFFTPCVKGATWATRRTTTMFERLLLFDTHPQLLDLRHRNRRPKSWPQHLSGVISCHATNSFMISIPSFTCQPRRHLQTVGSNQAGTNHAYGESHEDSLKGTMVPGWKTQKRFKAKIDGWPWS